MGSVSPGGVVAVGILVGLVSTCVQSIGLTLQRKSHILEDEKEEHIPRRAPYRRPRWQIGMALFLLSNIVGSSIQITTLPLPLLSTLQASGLVFNAILATILLQEPFTRRTAFGTILVAGGAVLISLFSAVPEPSHTLSQLLELLVVPNFVIWMSLTLVLVVAVLAGCFFLTHFIPMLKRRSPRMRLIRGMGYGLVSGILSAHSLLLAKSAVELLVRTIVDKKNQFGHWQSWILLILFLFFALTQLYYMHRGLKLVTTSILYPLVFCIYNIIAILDGLIYFRQMDRLPPLHAGLIALGTIILLTGVLALSWRLSEDESETSESQFHNGKLDLPQSALTPGMGFVDDETDLLGPAASDAEDDTEALAGEREPLIRRHSMRDSALLDAQKRRQRRSTIREVEAIWSELHDSAPSLPGPSSSTDNEEPRRAESPAKGIKRSKTAPGGPGKRRRRSTLGMWRQAWDDNVLGGASSGEGGGDKRKSWAGSIRLDWFRRKREEQLSQRDEEEERERPADGDE